MLHYLNSASQSQMQKLPSVGPKAAHCIISYRTMESGFPDLESLKLVPGLRKNFYDNFLKVIRTNCEPWQDDQLFFHHLFR